MVVKKTFHLTKEGVAELEKELAHLEAAKAEIADRIKTAREFGDLAENAEYQTARQDQDKNDSRISEVRHILQNVEIIKKPKSGGKVQLGSSVKLKNGKTMEFQVVGTVEADPLNGKISDESPIGRALLGKVVGDSVEIKTPVETATYKVVEIS
ncbi:MAG TPA: transcription elongation factor GreA [Candidatus Saccharimonadales bacterium]|nr:transcription elongation factor GreA [Candidatus Saccharimonadales bacterium]